MKPYVFLLALALLPSCASHFSRESVSGAKKPGFHGHYFHIRDLDNPPALISRTDPVVEASEQYRECVVAFIVDPEGAPQQVQWIKTNDVEFARSCVVAVKQWRFTPGLRSGAAVSCEMRVPLVVGDAPGSDNDGAEPLIE